MKTTEKQEIFAINFVMNGGDATDAYYNSHNVKSNTKRETVYSMASRLRHSAKVAARIHELQVQQLSPLIMTLEERKKSLTKQIWDGNLQAMDILNKMTGAYAADDDSKYTQNEIIDG